MKQFTVYTSETVHYKIPVEAKDAETARILIEDGHFADEELQVIDTENFKVDKVEEDK